MQSYYIGKVNGGTPYLYAGYWDTSTSEVHNGKVFTIPLTSTVIAAMEQEGKLDLLLQDDSAVDFATLSYDTFSPGVGGVTVTLNDSQNHTVGSTITGSDGTYSFTGLAQDTYTVTETVPANWIAITPSSYTLPLRSREELVTEPGQANLPPGDLRHEVLVYPQLVFCNRYIGPPLALRWSGGSLIDDTWSQGTNWMDGIAPTDGNLLIFDGTTRLDNTNDLTDGTLLSSGILFQNSAGAFTLNGNALILDGDITNQSSNTQTINLPLSIVADGWSIAAAAGPIVVGGDIDTCGYTLTVTGDSDTAIQGAVSGAGGLTKTGSGVLTLTGENSYSGDTNVLGGELHTTNIGSETQPTSNVEVQNGAHLWTDSIVTGTLTIGAALH